MSFVVFGFSKLRIYILGFLPGFHTCLKLLVINKRLAPRVWSLGLGVILGVQVPSSHILSQYGKFTMLKTSTNLVLYLISVVVGPVP